MQRFVECGDQFVDVVAPPVADIVEILAIARKCRFIGKVCAGVEIVIEVDTVHVVILHDLSSAVDYKFLHSGQAGVEIVVILVYDRPFRVLLGWAVIRQCVVFALAVLGDAVGVEPRMQL